MNFMHQAVSGMDYREPGLPKPVFKLKTRRLSASAPFNSRGLGSLNQGAVRDVGSATVHDKPGTSEKKKEAKREGAESEPLTSGAQPSDFFFSPASPSELRLKLKMHENSK